LQLPFLDLVCFNVYLESEERFESYLARLQNIAGDKPLLLTELGFTSNDGAAMGATSGPVDKQEQADLYEAFFRFWQTHGGDWMKGAFLWDWNPTAQADDATSYTIQGKPAENVVAKWFGATKGSAQR
jgi:hypothetical protein